MDYSDKFIDHSTVFLGCGSGDDYSSGLISIWEPNIISFGVFHSIL